MVIYGKISKMKNLFFMKLTKIHVNIVKKYQKEQAFF
jgi:hypothetical protein